MLERIIPQDTLPAVALQADILLQPNLEVTEPSELQRPASAHRVEQAARNVVLLVVDRVDYINESDDFVKATHDSM